MLNNKKIFIFNLCFGLSKLYTNIQQDQKAKLDYHMSMLFAYMAGGEGGGGLEVLKCFVRYLSIFLYCLRPRGHFRLVTARPAVRKGKDKIMTVRFIQDDKLKLLVR